MKRIIMVSLTLCFLVLISSGCSTAPKTQSGKSEIRNDAAAALSRAKRVDPVLSEVIQDAKGCAVFPSVGKGGIGFGGAYGKGVLYVDGSMVGYCDLSQATVGYQLGGQSYTEIICFETSSAVDNFKQGNFALDAQASAVALKAGVGLSAPYRNGVAVYTLDESGLMYEASVGGQKFSYQDK